MTMNPSGWRPEMSSGDGGAGAAPTFTGNRALMLEEPLIFEIGDSETTGVDLEAPPRVAGRLAGLEAQPTDRPGRPVRAGDRAPLYPPQPPELRDRSRPLPTRLVHDEA
jgi:hypothetical protein